MKQMLTFLLLLLSFTAIAQIKKGDKLVGVGIGAISYTSSDSKTTYSNTPTVYESEGSSFSISLNPNLGWFIMDKLAVGAAVNVSFNTSKSESRNSASTTTSDNKSTQPAFYIGPFARYYFGTGTKGAPFVQGNFQLGTSGGKSESQTSSGASSETTTKPKGDWNAGVVVGYEHFVTPNIGLFGSFGLNYGKSKTSYEYRPSTGVGYDYTSEYSRFLIPVNIGLQVHILGRQK
ncbi:MAG: hypothetical protein EOO88_37870 [Pedobacter sp.]|nr:MAG: hypothetical protein EOO88_37870 [Pedobacter sp.]